LGAFAGVADRVAQLRQQRRDGDGSPVKDFAAALGEGIEGGELVLVGAHGTPGF
jgi:hypothetical protein